MASLALIALWLGLARPVGQGRNWARIVSTVLFGLAALELAGLHGLTQVFPAGSDMADRPRRGVAALAPGVQRVLQAIRQSALARRP